MEGYTRTDLQSDSLILKTVTLKVLEKIGEKGLY